MPKRYRDVKGDGGSNIAGQVVEQRQRLQARMAQIRSKVAVMSGKGGVGKSTITTNLALFFAREGFRVGVVDADLNGPSLARMFGVRRQPLRIEEQGVLPAEGPLGIRLISMDFFLGSDERPVVWEGPQAESFLWRGTLEMQTLREFLADTQWGALDLLLIDLPPGIDRFSTLRDLLPDLQGTVVVTIPSAVSHLVVLKAITLAREILKAPLIGVVENMSGYLCPTCQQEGPLFPSARETMARLGIPLLGQIPFDPRLAEAADQGIPYLLLHGDTPVGQALGRVGEGVKSFLEEVNSV
ncbi:MAG: ATP-binding protein [Nitrospinota bacterium]|nr:MAG: ATP-binding protein [Nitrospinota bacterium]